MGFNLMRKIQKIERAETEKERTLKEMKSRLKKDWTARVLADSLEGSCINMKPSKIKYRLPTTPEEWKKVKRSTSIETPLHFNKEAERMIRQLVKEDIIKEAKKECPFCNQGFFLHKPSGNRLRLVTDYQNINALIERPEWPFLTTSNILSLVKGNLPWVC